MTEARIMRPQADECLKMAGDLASTNKKWRDSLYQILTALTIHTIFHERYSLSANHQVGDAYPSLHRRIPYPSSFSLNPAKVLPYQTPTTPSSSRFPTSWLCLRNPNHAFHGKTCDL